MAHLTAADRLRGVITASAGNHAQGVALAAQKLGCAATIVMPVTTPHIKIAAVAARGANVVLHGDSYSDAYAKALELQRESGATFVHPYDDPDVIAGQGTIGMEILRQWQGPLDAIFVAIGGGGRHGGLFVGDVEGAELERCAALGQPERGDPEGSGAAHTRTPCRGHRSRATL